MSESTPINEASGFDAAKVHNKVGLLLTGGGARAAYQAGVLRAITQIVKSDQFPYRFVSGTSAGSINAAFLAARAAQWPQASDDLVAVWCSMRAGSVFSTEAFDWYMRGARWVSWLALPRLIKGQPKSILDNTPLIKTLRDLINPDDISANLENGLFDALGIGASSYTTGRHVTFYQARDQIEEWQSADRVAIRSQISIQHLAASSAIPFVFSPVALPVNGRNEWFGDGTMRQSAPLLPLIEAGAHRILAISVSPEERASMFEIEQTSDARGPNLAQVAGHTLASVFYDALPAEIDQVNRINEALQLLSQQLPESFPFKPIEVLAISPSEPIEEIALRHVGSLPKRVRRFLKTFGATEATGMALASYLMFEPEFTSELVALGERDAFAKRDQISALFSDDDQEIDEGALNLIKTSLSAFLARFAR